jgi:hypothetical protein
MEQLKGEIKMLNEKTTKELKEMAKALKIKGWWEMKKTDLIAAIEEADVNTKETEENIPEVKNEAQEHTPKKKNKREFTYNDKTQNLSAWAKELGMPVQTLYNRLIMKNWPVEKAFTEPVKRGKKHE